jgi:hypothetical protein
MNDILHFGCRHLVNVVVVMNFFFKNLSVFPVFHEHWLLVINCIEKEILEALLCF